MKRSSSTHRPGPNNIREIVSVGLTLLGLYVLVVNFGIYWLMHPQLAWEQVWAAKWLRAIGAGALIGCAVGVWADLPAHLVRLLGRLRRKPSYTYKARGRDVW